MYSDISKHHPRDRYLVAQVEGDTLQLRKFAGKQLRSNAILAKPHEVYHAGTISKHQIRSPASIVPPTINSEQRKSPVDFNEQLSVPAEIVVPPETDSPTLNTSSPAPAESLHSDSDAESPLPEQPTPRRVLPKRSRPKPAWTKDYQMGRCEGEK